MRPRDLPAPESLIGPVHWDVETSGLYPDDGARISSVGVAWLQMPPGGPRRGCWETDGAGGLPHPIGVDRGCGRCRGTLRKAAFPFAQGRRGKPEWRGQEALFGEIELDGRVKAAEDPNLTERDWTDLLDWMEAVGRSWSRAAIGGWGVLSDAVDRRLVAHNAAFDLIMTDIGTMARPGVGQREWRGRDLSKWAWCSQVVAKEIWPDQPLGLEAVGQRLFGEGGKKVSLKGQLGPKDNPRFDLVEWGWAGSGNMLDYVMQDIDIGLLIASYELDVIEQGAANREWIRNELECMGALVAMEQRGLPYAVAESLDIGWRLKKRQDELARELPFKPTGTAAKKYFFTSNESVVDILGKGRVRSKGLDLVPYSVTEKGAPQLTEEHVDRIQKDYAGEPAAQVAATWAQWNKLETARSMWYQGYAEKTGPDGRLRTRFNQFGTRSERYSVSRVNLQAIPQDWRLGGEEGPMAGEPTPRALITKAIEDLPGWSGWELDFAQAELRSAAFEAECKEMMRLILAGEDLHGYTATRLFPGLTKDSPEWGFKRGVVGKRANFTLLFGAGWKTYSRMLSKEGAAIPDPEAQRVVKQWKYELFPEFERKIDRDSRFAERRGYIPLVNGKRRWFAPYEDRHKAFNQRIQGSLAELGKAWLVRTERYLRSLELDELGVREGVGRGGLLLVIHDSQVLLLPDELRVGNATMKGATIAEACAEFGRQCWKEFYPHIPGGVDVKQWGKK